MRYLKIKFQNHDGDKLGARLDLPSSGEPHAYALFAHCFTCSKNLRAVGHISRALTEAGIAVFRFDFTGLGESEGDFADTNFSSNIADLVAAADYLASQHRAPKLLIGHSLGGAAVLQAAGQIESAVAVATIGAPCSPEHVTHLLESKRDEIEAAGQAVVNLAGRQFTIKKQFLDDLEASRMQASIRTLKRALVIFHSPIDNTVGIENAAEIFKTAKHPKSFISLDQADHLLTNEGDARYVGEMIAAWVRRFLPAEAADKSEVEGVVVHTGRERFRTEIITGHHRLLADEPESAGGTDTGPTPYDLLAAALGACTSITLRMYADHKKWPLEAVAVRLQHQKIHADDCENCETKTGKIDTITRRLVLHGDLNAEQRQRLLEIADRCPVHRTLHAEVKVDTHLVEEE